MINKIRLHKKVQSIIQEQDLEYTIPEVKKNITNYGVKVNELVQNNHMLWTFDFDKIDISHWPLRQKGNFSNLVIVYQNQDFIVVNKPINVVVEPGAGHAKDNLIEYFKEKYQQEVFTVHRIDKDTQGLLLLAKNPTALEFLQAQFKQRLVEKKYLALVNGMVEKIYWIKNWQARDKNDPLKQKLFWSEQEALNYDKSAKFAYSILQPKITCKEIGQSIIQMQIFTGRMHQIRLQCEALGFELVNDKIYNRGEKLPLVQLKQPKFREIGMKLKFGTEYYKQSLVDKKKGGKRNGQNADIQETNEEQLIEPLKSFYPSFPIQELSMEAFNQSKINLFGDTDYCLLANYLKFKGLEGRYYEFELKSI